MTPNKPWEKSLQCIQATISGLSASERSLHDAIDAMPPDLLKPGEITVLEMQANRIADLMADLMKTHTQMARKIRNIEEVEP